MTNESSNASNNAQLTAEPRRKRAARKLGITDRDGVYGVKRPKGMHYKTFERLQKAVVDALIAEDEAFENALSRHVSLRSKA